MHDRNAILTQESTRGSRTKALVVLGCTLATVLACWLAPAPKAGGEAGVVMTLPDHVGDLHGFPEPISPAELAVLPADTTYAKQSYGATDSVRLERIFSEIVLSGAEKRSIHRPERCLPAQGWRIESSHTETVELASGHSLKVTALYLAHPFTLTDGRQILAHQYFLYWFVGKGITTPYQTQRILMTNWQLLAHRVNQRWAYVIASAYVLKDWNPNAMDADQTLQRLKQFIHDSAPSYIISEMPEKKTASN